MKKLSEIKNPIIGERYLTDEGKVVVCVESDDCYDCAIERGTQICATKKCVSSIRDDKKNVYFPFVEPKT